MEQSANRSRFCQLAAGALFLAAVGCGPSDEPDVSNRSVTSAGGLPPMKTFVSQNLAPTLRSNQDLARDFMDLNFRLETGRELLALSRFEGPITVRVAGNIPGSLPTDLSRLIRRLRNEAGLNISLTDQPTANINIILKSKASLARTVPGAACFAVPNVTSFEDFQAKRNGGSISWLGVIERKTASIILPSDASPQELRDCLHEELAQALGPLNDLYRLPDSVFNDDNFNSVLTRFDMLMLRTLYDANLKSGMSPHAVQNSLPRILARLNPRGQSVTPRVSPETSRAWSQAIQEALANSSVQVKRQQAARRAIQLQANSVSDVRNGFAHYAMGRLTMSTNPSEALQYLRKADAIFAGGSDMAIHRAKVAVQLAAFALRDGNPQQVFQVVDPFIPVALANENATVLASLLMFRAEALDLVGRSSEAQSVRLDALGWARYGYGSKTAVLNRLKEIQALSPA